MLFLSTRTIWAPAGMPPCRPGSALPPSPLLGPAHPADSPGDAAVRTRCTEERRMGQVNLEPPQQKVPLHTHKHTLSVRFRKGEVTLCCSLSFKCFFVYRAVRNESVDVKMRLGRWDSPVTVTSPRLDSLPE